MKQGILITAYKDFDQLFRLVESFDERFAIYIHIDKKSKVPNDLETKLKTIPSVALITRKFSVNWGGRNHLLSILHLVEESLKDETIGYCHLITGQDFPIRSNDEFDAFFQKNKGTEFLEHFAMPADCWNHGGMDRIQYYNLYDVFNAKTAMKTIQRIKNFQSRLGIKRSLSRTLPSLYGGSTYWSLSREALSKVIQYTQETPQLLKRLKHSFCSEEIYFQTILMNSSLAQRVKSDNLRFIVWEKGSSSPAMLTREHLEAAIKTDAFFARKFESATSDGLLNRLKELRTEKKN